MRIPFVSSNRIRIITQHGNDLPVFAVILLVIGIRLIRNVNPDAIFLREALRAENDQLHDRIETLETEVAALRDERDHLTERIDTLQRETAKLRGRIDDCTDLADRVTTLETRPHIEWDTKDFDDAVVTHPNGPDYPIGTALANRPQRDEIERDIDTILGRIGAGEVNTNRTRD